MTPQSNFMVLAPVGAGREAKLRRLLDTMNSAPGCVDPKNALIPFAAFDELHFARLVILDDQTTGDVRYYGLPVETYPLYLAFLGDVDGDVNAFLEKLAGTAGQGLSAIFSCCEEFALETDLVEWMKRHLAPPAAAYVNYRGRTVRQIHEEEALGDALQDHIGKNETALRTKNPRELHAALRQFVDGEISARRLVLSEEAPTPVGWRIKNFLHLVSWPLLVLALSPFLILIAPFYLWMLRRLETSDPVVCPTVSQEYSEYLSRSEDHYVTNSFTAMGSLKPGLLRLFTTMGVLTLVNYAARHLVRQGRLGRIRTIHFARWVFVAGTRRMAFFSNYDGSVESYMDDFINKTGFGLNASFSNGIGYPMTNWLVLDGCSDERKYKEFLRRHTLASQVWYKAYPGLTAVGMERNSRLRQGLESSSMSDDELREWISLL